VTTGITMSWYFSDGVLNCTFYGLNNAHTYNVNLLILDE
jgi:hypothetical protein